MVTAKELRDLVQFPQTLYPYGQREPDGSPHCLSTLRWSYEKYGVELPSDYISLLSQFRKIQQPEFLDVVAIAVRFPFVDHVGIYIDNGEFVHCAAGHHVLVSSVEDSKWGDRIVAYLRHRKKEEWLK